MFAVLVSVDIATSTNGREKCVAENLHINIFRMPLFSEIFQNRKLHDLGNFKIISAGQEGLIEVEN